MNLTPGLHLIQITKGKYKILTIPTNIDIDIGPTNLTALLWPAAHR